MHPHMSRQQDQMSTPQGQDDKHLDITDISTKHFGLDQIPRHQIHVFDADLHEGLDSFPGKAHEPPLESTDRAILVGRVHDSLVSPNVGQTAQMHIVERRSSIGDACRHAHSVRSL